MWTGHRIPLNVDPSARMNELQDFLQRQFGNPPESYKLLRNTVQLNTAETLGSQGVVEGSVLDFQHLTSGIPF